MLCVKCGKDCQEDWKFCPDCFTKLSNIALKEKIDSQSKDNSVSNMIRYGILGIIALMVLFVFLPPQTVNQNTSYNAPAKAIVTKNFVAGQEYYMDDSSVIAKDSGALLTFYDCIKNNDRDGIRGLISQGKIFFLSSKTKIMVTYEMDKDIASVEILSGPHITKTGYTFAKYITK